MLVSCTTEDSVSITTIYKNSSGYKVELTPYKDGLIINEYYRIIGNGETEKIGYGAKHASYSTDLMFMDSVVVIFDGKKKSVHYKTMNGTNLRQSNLMKRET
jgi:hypothetical protein